MAQERPTKSDHRESGIVQRLRRSVREIPIERPDVLLACSGGKDSVALAYLLAEMQRLGLLTFRIAHIHHGQHERADTAAEAVRRIGKALDVPVAVHCLDQQDIDGHSSVGLEEAMRRERYLALAGIAAENHADCIALAHHQTDQSETILLHLMRGAGIDGLAGMRAWEVRRIPWWESANHSIEIGLWRPLIGESADDVAHIATKSGLPIVEDPTNIDPGYRRNAIRHQVLPVLEDISPGSTAAIARSAEIIASDAELLQVLTSQALIAALEGDQLSRRSLMPLSRAMQQRVVRLWVLDRLPDVELSAERVGAILELAGRNRGGTVVEIGSGYQVTLQRGFLTID